MADNTKKPVDGAKPNLAELVEKAVALSKNEQVQQALKLIPGLTSGAKDLSPADQTLLDDLDTQIKKHREEEQKLLKQFEENNDQLEANDELMAKSKAVVAQLDKDIAQINNRIADIRTKRAALDETETELEKEIRELKEQQAKQHEASEKAQKEFFGDSGGQPPEA